MFDIGVVGVLGIVGLLVLVMVLASMYSILFSGGSTSSSDMVFSSNVVVCVVVVCEWLVVSINVSVGVVFCVMLRSACSVEWFYLVLLSQLVQLMC